MLLLLLPEDENLLAERDGLLQDGEEDEHLAAVLQKPGLVILHDLLSLA